MCPVENNDVRGQILDATYECVTRWGIAKTKVEDAAKQAKVSRATIYRYFPGGREELMREVVALEYQRFFARLYEAIETAGSLEEIMERGLLFAHRAIATHSVLQQALANEPGTLLPTITAYVTETKDVIASVLLPYLEKHELASGVDPKEAADFLARMVLSFMGSQGRWNLEDPEQAARLVRAELLGGIVPA